MFYREYFGRHSLRLVGQALVLQRLRARRHKLTLAHIPPKHGAPDAVPDYLSGRAETLSPVEEALPDYIKDGLRMFRTAAAVLAPGRTVGTQIRAVAKALYPLQRNLGASRIKACCYREAGKETILDVKYRLEAWWQRHNAKALRELEALQERRNKLREAPHGRNQDSARK